MFSECAGFARDFAKVVDQVRFLARAFRAYNSFGATHGPHRKPTILKQVDLFSRKD